MLDVVFPVSVPNLGLTVEALDLLQQNLEIPTRLIAIVDGGVRSDFAHLESFLRGCEMEWMLLHEDKPVYLNRAIAAGIEQTKAPFVAVMRPHVRLCDDRWFTKMHTVVSKDHLCGIIDTIPDTKSSTIHPVKRSQHRPPDEDCPLVLLSGRFARGAGQAPHLSKPVPFWFRKAMNTGGSAWHAGGVHYTTVPHEEHKAWLERSASPASSRSRSRTTPASSTATTTGRAGSEDSRL